MTTLDIQESLFGKLPIAGASCPYIERLKCHLLISIQTLYIPIIVPHTNSYITLG